MAETLLGKRDAAIEARERLINIGCEAETLDPGKTMNFVVKMLILY